MDWAAMLLYIAVSSVTPGPNNLMSLYLGAHYGLSGARKFIVGSMGSVLVKLLLCAALNLALAEIVPALVPYLKWLGAGYMLYLAFVMLRSGFQAQKDEEETGGESTYLSGILLQCLNMKSWVFALSVFSTFVIPHTTSLRDADRCSCKSCDADCIYAFVDGVRQCIPPRLQRAPQSLQRGVCRLAGVLCHHGVELRGVL